MNATPRHAQWESSETLRVADRIVAALCEAEHLRCTPRSSTAVSSIDLPVVRLRPAINASSAGMISVPMKGRWLSHERFEAIAGWHDLMGHVSGGGRVEIVFDERSGLPAGVGMRLLSLLNQMAALGSGSVHLAFASREGLYGYLNRNGFFDFLDQAITSDPSRPVFSSAKLYRGQAGSLVEIAALVPDVVGEARQDAVVPLIDALNRMYAGGARATQLLNSTYSTLTELIDNVYSHSETALPGFAILQAYPNRARPAVQIAVSDSGIGIPESLRRSLGTRVRRQSDGKLIVQAFEKGLSRLGRQTGRSCGLPRCAQLAMHFGSTVFVRTPSADVTLTPMAGGAHLTASVRLPHARLEGTHICLEFPLDRKTAGG